MCLKLSNYTFHTRVILCCTCVRIRRMRVCVTGRVFVLYNYVFYVNKSKQINAIFTSILPIS